MKLTQLCLVTCLIGLSGCSGERPDSLSGARSLPQLRATIAQSDYRTVVQQLYIAYFGRPADSTGLANFMFRLSELNGPVDIQALDAAYTTVPALRELIDSFGSSEESKALYAGDTDTFVTAIYQNLLSRAPDSEGKAFWVNAINNGGLTRARASFSIMAAALVNASAQGQLDGALIRNRVAIGTHFTDSLITASEIGAYSGNAAAARARAMLAGVLAGTDPVAFRGNESAAIADLLNAAGATHLVITHGGTYSGSWASLDPKVPAIEIRTTEPVLIENCTIRAKADLIYAMQSNAHVTIRNCRGYGLDPKVNGQSRGSFFQSYQIGSLTAENNYIEATNFGFNFYSTDGWQADGPIVIRFNSAKNLDGAPSDGNGGRDLSRLPYGGQDNGNHFAILATLQNLTRAEIAWNYILSEPATSSVGDTINVYSSSGTAASPILIHNNFIQGGYPADPNATTYHGGGITMDGRSTDTAQTATAYVRIYDNQIVAHASFGIGLESGHDNVAYRNRVVSSGQYANGNWFFGYVGVWITNGYKTPSTVFFNNWAYDNIVGYNFEWAYPSNPNVFAPPAIRQDYILTECSGGLNVPQSKCTGNISLPDPVTAATEANEFTLWQQKLASNGIVVGPLN